MGSCSMGLVWNASIYRVKLTAAESNVIWNKGTERFEKKKI